MLQTAIASGLVLAVLLAHPTAVAAQETVDTRERTFRVKYQDGTTELYKVRWQAQRSIDVREDGHPAEPFAGRPFDTRTCHWSINAYISRRVFLVARNGKEFENVEKARVFNSDFTNQGSSFVLANLRPENCNDARARRDSDWNDTRRKLLGAVPSVSTSDFEALKQDYVRDGAVFEAVS